MLLRLPFTSRFELHNTACCSVPVKGLPLTLMGGAGGTAALAQLVPGADAEERELEELAADQGHSGILPVGDEAEAASDHAVTGGDVEVVLWLGSGEKDIIEAAYNSFRYSICNQPGPGIDVTVFVSMIASSARHSLLQTMLQRLLTKKNAC